MSPLPASDTSVKAEPVDTAEKPVDGGSPQPPPSVTVTAEVKKEEPKGEFGKDGEDDSDKPCTKMTMRLRRNINNPQCVSSCERTQPEVPTFFKTIVGLECLPK